MVSPSLFVQLQLLAGGGVTASTLLPGDLFS
jgi:hypothetical protein